MPVGAWGFLIILCYTIISGILYVLFGEVTVRKLRKNAATRDELGSELMSGWDILNAAQALSIPNGLAKRLSSSPIGSLYANSDVLHKYTSNLDRFLAHIFYWTFMGGFIASILIILFLK